MVASRRPTGAHVLIAGSGVAALETAFALRALAGELVYLEILAPEPKFFYRPQAVFEPFGGGRVDAFDVGELAEALSAQFTPGALASVVPSAHVARTTQGLTIPYDMLVIASGVSPAPVLRDALTFRGPADAERVTAIAQSATRGDTADLTLAIPTQLTWPLPLYELALGLRAVTDASITLATVEPLPGAVLGSAGSAYLAARLASRRIKVVTEVEFARFQRGVTISAPVLRAGRLFGVPSDDGGFIPIDPFGAVVGAPAVYAAGDVTDAGVKHGSLAAGQADTVAETIAAASGADLRPTPFKRVLSARIACGNDSFYVRRDLDDPDDEGLVSLEPLWSPPAKIFARHLAPALAEISRRRQRSLFSAT